MNIEALGLSVRAYNVLKRAGFNTVEQICEKSAWEISSLRNMGKSCMEEIRDKVLNAGYDAFGMPGRKPSHADWIRSMDDENLAVFIFDLGNGREYCYGHCIHQDNEIACNEAQKTRGGCLAGVLEWLRAPKEGTV